MVNDYGIINETLLNAVKAILGANVGELLGFVKQFMGSISGKGNAGAAYILLLSFYFWNWNRDIKPARFPVSSRLTTLWIMLTEKGPDTGPFLDLMTRFVL